MMSPGYLPTRGRSAQVQAQPRLTFWVRRACLRRGRSLHYPTRSRQARLSQCPPLASLSDAESSPLRCAAWSPVYPVAVGMGWVVVRSGRDRADVYTFPPLSPGPPSTRQARLSSPPLSAGFAALPVVRCLLYEGKGVDGVSWGGPDLSWVVVSAPWTDRQDRLTLWTHCAYLTA